MTPVTQFFSILNELKDFIAAFFILININLTLIAFSLIHFVIKIARYIKSGREVHVYHHYPEDPEGTDPDGGEELERDGDSNKQREVINFPPKAS